ncbi:MAG: 2-oxoglutarate dehydrogenase E1 component [Leptospiraceae bacterium]|nr:2-oxoglutarate dehydrogenase E1 component [Leptospiraceae bacterium]MCP5496624.1 2-oxoglutarate dehydrogenase E1 component [Leptospiraceae bacterium]
MITKNDYSYLTGSDNAYIDALYETYQSNPNEIDESWNLFFKGFEYKLESIGGERDDAKFKKEFNVFRFIQSFRARGHLLSDTNPIRHRKDRHARISLQDYNLEESDLETTFFVAELAGLGKPTKLKDIIEHMRRIYCNKIGIEFMHSNNTEYRRWARSKFEREYHTIDLPIEKKKRILEKLNEAQVFESFLQTKYPGQKRFSLEGGESTIPAIDALINKGTELGIKEFVIGMAHRGRLNVLANIIGKSYEFIFNEFEGGPEGSLHMGGGDVKYHLGYSSIRQSTGGKEVYLKLMHNPSHLEAVGPVTLGYAHAQGDIRYGFDFEKVCPIIIHGDAAVAAQGVVYESLQMAELKAYHCGGAIHFIINNQIGFTTDFEDARSSHYSTSIARTLDAPILHVNGDDPESVVYAIEFAVEFRQKFKTDIFVDMVCYRKHGHNEGDEPKYTQPHLYGLIQKQKNPRELYTDHLIQQGEIQAELAKKMEVEFKQLLSDRLNNVKQKELPQKIKGPHTEWLEYRWSKPEDFDKSPETGYPKEKLEHIIEKITTVPEGFHLLEKAKKILEDRKKTWDEDKLDWAICELLAYGTMLMDKRNVRFSGQDVIRGTFSHRHAKVYDEKTNTPYCGLAHLSEDQGILEIYNSHLSEYAVLGFEYGYSLATPHGLNVWEAQFGDFANNAQVIIDQFVSSGESKWEKMTDLVLLLPHGYEGQGSEHSSARPERFLQLTAEDNMVIVNCTTPTQFFHVLRRQQAWEFRKPLVVFTPKSLLRDPRCISQKADLETGAFREVMDDTNTEPKNVTRVLVCTGKVYYDLFNEQQNDKRKDVAIVRLEQLYPFPLKQFQELLKRYKDAQFFWVQEEPENMGYWSYLLSRHLQIFKDFTVVARPISASPATGFSDRHKKERQDILTKSFQK